jgi:hypothetical protein
MGALEIGLYSGTELRTAAGMRARVAQRPDHDPPRHEAIEARDAIEVAASFMR